MRTAGPHCSPCIPQAVPFSATLLLSPARRGKEKKILSARVDISLLFRSCAAHAPRKTRTSSIEFSVWAFARICGEVYPCYSFQLPFRPSRIQVRFTAAEGDHIGALQVEVEEARQAGNCSKDKSFEELIKNSATLSAETPLVLRTVLSSSSAAS